MRELKRMVYFIGEPGSGKSTLVKALLTGLTPREELIPFAHAVYPGDPGGIVLGRDRETFAGTDALSMNVQPRVVAFLGLWTPAYVLGEGDRLANDTFFRAVGALGYTLDVLTVACAPEVAEARRRARGSQQNPAWVEGRRTKTRRLADRWSWPDLTFDTTEKSPEELAEEIRTHPVLRALHGETPESRLSTPGLRLPNPHRERVG